jgi:protease PrsW
MTALNISIVTVASLVGVAYLYKIRSYDIYEKEPFIKLFLVALAGGIISILTTMFLYEWVEVKLNFIDAIIKIGFIEESSKLFALILIYGFIRKDFNEIVDGIIYITAISLGFAIIENIFYALRSGDPYTVLSQRSVYAVIGHISFSGYMGISFYIHTQIRKNYTGIAFSVVLAALAHGFYDGVLFHEKISFLFQFVFLLLFIFQFWLLRTALGFSEFREKLSNTTFTDTNKVVLLNCCNCDISMKTKEIEFWSIKAGICPSCGNIVFNGKNSEKLFQYFRPIKYYDTYMKSLPKNERNISLDESKRILINKERKYLSAEVNNLGTWLDENNNKDREKVFQYPLIGFVLKQLGLKYIDRNKEMTTTINYEKTI